MKFYKKIENFFNSSLGAALTEFSMATFVVPKLYLSEVEKYKLQVGCYFRCFKHLFEE